ncbi:hypothetical protein FB567DRAFT_509859 [Paraphoma chrysanthemicola]|uniref:Uncharacterized protein n=1 Tax=Paraphoma chrysanthemicola TaxID=798071 RepID=A0A8K0W3Y8_9PLEO|nr:hypothetical protein FB567DRAFT_509859 [Paraphoma chrysanthemicola]
MDGVTRLNFLVCFYQYLSFILSLRTIIVNTTSRITNCMYFGTDMTSSQSFAQVTIISYHVIFLCKT